MIPRLVRNEASLSRDAFCSESDDLTPTIRRNCSGDVPGWPARRSPTAAASFANDRSRTCLLNY